MRACVTKRNFGPKENLFWEEPKILIWTLDRGGLSHFGDYMGRVLYVICWVFGKGVLLPDETGG